MPSVMRLVGALAGMDEPELRATFNGGLGMIVVVPPDAIPAAIVVLAERGFEAQVVGEVVDSESLAGARYVEGPLEALERVR